MSPTTRHWRVWAGSGSTSTVTQDQGVEEYLRLVREHGPDLSWRVVANQNGTVNKVAFGDPSLPTKYFYLYASTASAAPYSV